MIIMCICSVPFALTSEANAFAQKTFCAFYCTSYEHDVPILVYIYLYDYFVNDVVGFWDLLA